jgi:hypothetical protein
MSEHKRDSLRSCSESLSKTSLPYNAIPPSITAYSNFATEPKSMSDINDKVAALVTGAKG